MLSPVFWLVFLGTFLVVKSLADAWIGLPMPTPHRRGDAGPRRSGMAPPESENPLRRAA